MSKTKKGEAKAKAEKKAKTSQRTAATPKKAGAGAVEATGVVGPLTLAQARAWVAAKQAVVLKAAPRAKGAAAKSLTKPLPAEAVTPVAVAAERQRLDQQRRRALKQQLRDYKATMTLLKQRGVKGLQPEPVASGLKGAKGAKAVKAAEVVELAKAARGPAVRPLQILAEGDSWFDYPVPLFGGGVISHLEHRVGLPILNLAKAGDEVRYMMGVEERKILTKHLQDGCPAGGGWDVLLFSGGGNDIVANPMALWIKDFDPRLSPRDQIHTARFEAALALVRAGYEDLIALRDQLSPDTWLVFHGYDFAIPDGRGICHLGPWLKPTFDLRGFPDRDRAFAVVKVMLQQFAAMLAALESHPKVSFINAQGTLVPEPASWHNELHPSRAGFKRFSEIFHERLKTLFPGRVLP